MARTVERFGDGGGRADAENLAFESGGAQSEAEGAADEADAEYRNCIHYRVLPTAGAIRRSCCISSMNWRGRATGRRR